MDKRKENVNFSGINIIVIKKSQVMLHTCKQGCHFILICLFLEGACIRKIRCTYSKFFTVSNGVRHGSILNPFLFAVYMNQLSQTLNKLNIGCFIGQHCLNNILYANDICCIAPSCKGLPK